MADNGKIDGKLTEENLEKVPVMPPILDMDIYLTGYELKQFPAEVETLAIPKKPRILTRG